MPTVELIISQPGQKARKLEMSKKLVSIGRKPDNTIALEGDSNVSKYHAVIEMREDGFWLSDLGSSNGTTVNDQPIKTERKLQSGDLIGIGGSSTVKFQMPEQQQEQARAMPENAVAPAPAAAELNAAPAAASAETGASAAGATAAAASGAAAPAPAASSGISSTLIIAGVVGSLLMVGAIVAILFGTGVIGGASARKKSPLEEKREERARLEAEEKATEEGADKGGDDSSAAKGTGDTQAAAAKALSQMPDETTGALGATVAPSGAAANTDEMGAMARTLAVQIAQKSAYNFDPAFIAFIRNYVNEYRAAAGYYERARRYRDAVDREFINVQGIQPPLIGYVTAMSRTRFVEGGEGGVWGLPPAVVSSNSPGAAPVNMSDPDASTRVAASYMKDLLDLFERENFMYAVACYGMTLDEAGKVKAELEQKDPGAQLRFDFWKMKNAGVVKGDQVERVARFFAAGIVAENPQRFGLQDRPLSSLY